MKYKYIAIAILFFTLISLILPFNKNQRIAASPEKKISTASPRVTVIIIPGLSFLELEQKNLPHLNGWIESGAIGAMNVRTAARDKSPVHSYATLGLGQRAYGDDQLGGGYNASERIKTIVDQEPHGPLASQLMERWTGRTVDPRQIVIPIFPKFIASSTEIDYSQSLGTILREAGKNIVVLGNADRGTEKRRYGPWMTADVHGSTAYGDVGENTFKVNPKRPYGIQTHYDYLLQQKHRYESDADLIVIELGDLDRLYATREWYPPPVFEQAKREVMTEIDQFVGRLTQSMKAGETLMLLSPNVHPDADQENYLLAPILMKGQGIPAGTLTSATTERKGVVGNLDVAPTLLQKLKLEIPAAMTGEAMQVVPTSNAISFLFEELEHIVFVYSLRPSVMYIYITYQVAVLLIALTLVVRKMDLWLKRMRVALYSLMIAPLLFLWLGVLGEMSKWMFLAAFALGLFILSYLFSKVHYLQAWMWIGFSNVLFVLADGWMGGYFIKRSLLGYDPMIGARYYGIGNEFMGIVVGATLLFAASVIEWNRRSGWLFRLGTMSFFGLVIVYFAAPFLGTNAGGALAATIGFGIGWYRMFGSNKASWLKPALFLVALPVFGIAALFLLNYVIPSGVTSHIGKAFQLLAEGNVSEIADITKRKLMMNWRLIQVSSWSKLFIASLFVIVVMLLKPIRPLQSWIDRYPYLMAGFVGITTGALAALLLNDSGIVAAATTIIYAVVPMLLLGVEEKVHVAPGESNELYRSM
jgi:hypothetical protein